MSTGKPAKSAVRRQGIRDIVVVLSSYSLSPLPSNPLPNHLSNANDLLSLFFACSPFFSPKTKPKPKVSDTSHFFSLANNSLTEPYFASQSISSLSPSISKKLWEGHWEKKKKRKRTPFIQLWRQIQYLRAHQCQRTLRITKDGWCWMHMHLHSQSPIPRKSFPILCFVFGAYSCHHKL